MAGQVLRNLLEAHSRQSMIPLVSSTRSLANKKKRIWSAATSRAFVSCNTSTVKLMARRSVPESCSLSRQACRRICIKCCEEQAAESNKQVSHSPLLPEPCPGRARDQEFIFGAQIESNASPSEDVPRPSPKPQFQFAPLLSTLFASSGPPRGSARSKTYTTAQATGVAGIFLYLDQTRQSPPFVCNTRDAW